MSSFSEFLGDVRLPLSALTEQVIFNYYLLISVFQQVVMNNYKDSGISSYNSTA
jgi:hypothetical protein